MNMILKSRILNYGRLKRSLFLYLLFLFYHIASVMCFNNSRITILSRDSNGFLFQASENFEFDEFGWTTPDGIEISMLSCKGKYTLSNHHKQSPILFLHGSFHSAWCYREHFMPYFSSCGYDCFAMSLRGTKASALSADVTSVRIEEHVGDVSFVLDQIFRDSRQRPIVVAHSFGGLLLMKILERPEMRDVISAAIFLCSIPPSGNGAMTKRFLAKSPLLSLKIVWGFVLRGVTTNADLCRELFFDSQLTAELLTQYMAHFKEDSKVVVDFAALSGVLPSRTSMRTDGSAAWLPPPPTTTDVATTTADYAFESPTEHGKLPARVVIGARQDRIVDKEGLQETARYLGVQALQLPTLCHDVMLASEWRAAADLIAEQLIKISNS